MSIKENRQTDTSVVTECTYSNVHHNSYVCRIPCIISKKPIHAYTHTHIKLQKCDMNGRKALLNVEALLGICRVLLPQ